VWLDIDNPPQVRYLLPLARRFEMAGCDTLLTARASENTLAILESEGAEYYQIGTSFGKGVARKLYGVAARYRLLVDFLNERREKIDLVVTGSRAATLAARRLGLRSFVIIDYEHANVVIYRLAGSHIIHPDVIPADAFTGRGIPPRRLIRFGGLKEDLSFADVDVAAVPAHSFGPNGPVRVLFRPPAEESHYYRSESRRLAVDLLAYLAQAGAEVIFSPRYERQVEYLEHGQRWRRPPLVLRRVLPSVALLKGVDAVVSAGGTMLREAAFLGVPAYSIFRSRIGAVDNYLASLGRLSILESSRDFARLELRKNDSLNPLRQGRVVIDTVVEMILDRAR
jgi:predicted glycosyltransferase